MKKTFTLTVDSDGTCTVLKGADEHKELFNHWGNACSYIQKEAEKFVAEMRMERNVKVEKELDEKREVRRLARSSSSLSRRLGRESISRSRRNAQGDT